jgi:hypothetical protein
MIVIVYNRLITLLLPYAITLVLYLSSELLDVRENTRLVVLVIRPEQTEIANRQRGVFHLGQLKQHLNASLRPKGVVPVLGNEKPTALVMLSQGELAHPSAVLNFSITMTISKEHVQNNESRVSLKGLQSIVSIPMATEVKSSGQIQDGRFRGHYQLGGVKVLTALRKVNLVPGTTDTKGQT